MSFLDGLIHLGNFLLPPFGLGAIAALLTKLAWWRTLRRVSWLRLAGWAGTAALGVALAGLIVFGRDGKMLTYAGMVAASAGALWWVGLRD